MAAPQRAVRARAGRACGSVEVTLPLVNTVECEMKRQLGSIFTILFKSVLEEKANVWVSINTFTAEK